MLPNSLGVGFDAEGIAACSRVLSVATPTEAYKKRPTLERSKICDPSGVVVTDDGFRGRHVPGVSLAAARLTLGYTLRSLRDKERVDYDL